MRIERSSINREEAGTFYYLPRLMLLRTALCVPLLALAPRPDAHFHAYWGGSVLCVLRWRVRGLSFSPPYSTLTVLVAVGVIVTRGGHVRAGAGWFELGARAVQLDDAICAAGLRARKSTSARV